MIHCRNPYQSIGVNALQSRCAAKLSYGTGSLSEYERRKLHDPQRSYAEALNLNLCVWFQIRFTVETVQNVGGFVQGCCGGVQWQP